MRIKSEYKHNSPVIVSQNIKYGVKVQTGLRPGMALGDCCAGLIHFTGLDRFANMFTNLTGKDCGCKARQNWLNQLVPNFLGK